MTLGPQTQFLQESFAWRVDQISVESTISREDLVSQAEVLGKDFAGVEILSNLPERNYASLVSISY